MKKRILWITQTAVMLALLITLQAVTKSFGQLVTGSFVNAVLAVSVLFGGWGCGVTVALLSPIFAFILGIAPNALTVPVIMVGNTFFVLALRLFCRGTWVRQVGGLLLSSGIKFIVLHELVVKVICGVAADYLLSQGLLKAPMLNALPITFSWPQLVTALIGGAVALMIAPALKKALHRVS